MNCSTKAAHLGQVAHNYLSDFVLTQQIKELGVTLNYDEFDWEIDYFTTPLGKHYTASCKDGVLTNAIKLDEQTVLIVFNTPGFIPGTLKFEATLSIPNKSFPTGFETAIVPGETQVLIVEGKGDMPVKIDIGTLEQWLAEGGG